MPPHQLASSQVLYSGQISVWNCAVPVPVVSFSTAVSSQTRGNCTYRTITGKVWLRLPAVTVTS